MSSTYTKQKNDLQNEISDKNNRLAEANEEVRKANDKMDEQREAAAEVTKTLNKRHDMDQGALEAQSRRIGALEHLEVGDRDGRTSHGGVVLCPLKQRVGISGASCEVTRKRLDGAFNPPDS